MGKNGCQKCIVGNKVSLMGEFVNQNNKGLPQYEF